MENFGHLRTQKANSSAGSCNKSCACPVSGYIFRDFAAVLGKQETFFRKRQQLDAPEISKGPAKDCGQGGMEWCVN